MFSCPLELDYLCNDPLPTWPVTWPIAVAPGVLRDGEALVVRDADGKTYPTQTRSLAYHPDGSPRRLIVTAEPPLIANAKQTFELTAGVSPSPQKPATIERLCHADGALMLDGYAITFNAEVEGESLALTMGAIEPFETGPVCAAAVLRGTFITADGEALLHLRLTVRLYAATPVAMIDVLLKNLSDRAAVEVKAFEMIVTPPAPWRDTACELGHLPRACDAEMPLAVKSDRMTVSLEAPGMSESNGGRLLNYNETWFAMEGTAGALVAGLPNFFEYYPYGVAVEAERLTLQFQPRWADEPWRIAQGSGKTHQVGLYMSDTIEVGRAAGYAIGKPPLARVPLETLQAAGAYTDLLPYEPDAYPRIETTMYDLVYNRNRGYGKMNWGDDYSALYTNQGRGNNHIVWNNLEGDHPYHVYRQFLRTGRYAYAKDFRDSILHWADVDFCDKSDDPRREGGLSVHSAEHVTKRGMPCHNWTEGFCEWYYATGDPRPVEILHKMIEWLLRNDEAGFFQTEKPYVRGCGWGLIQMTALQQLLPDARIEALIKRLCAGLLAYCRAHGGLVMTMPTGGTWTPVHAVFHDATVAVGAHGCWRLYGDEEMKTLALEAAAPLMDRRGCTPEGIATYISGPEQDFPMQQAAGIALAALAVAYDLTGDEAYIRRGMRMLEYCLDRGMIVDHMRVPGAFIETDGQVILEPQLTMPNTQLLSYQMRGLLHFIKPAHDTGMLKQVDYRF